MWCGARSLLGVASARLQYPPRTSGRGGSLHRKLRHHDPPHPLRTPDVGAGDRGDDLLASRPRGPSRQAARGMGAGPRRVAAVAHPSLVGVSPSDLPPSPDSGRACGEPPCECAAGPSRPESRSAHRRARAPRCAIGGRPFEAERAPSRAPKGRGATCRWRSADNSCRRVFEAAPVGEQMDLAGVVVLLQCTAFDISYRDPNSSANASANPGTTSSPSRLSPAATIRGGRSG